MSIVEVVSPSIVAAIVTIVVIIPIIVATTPSTEV